MRYEKFLADNLIKKQKPDFGQISEQIARSLKDLKTAEANMKIDLTWAFTIIYHSMIRAGRALMYSKGYLPTVKQTHKTIIEFTGLLLGSDFDNIIMKFNRMRRQRHDFIYDSKNHIILSEIKSSLEAARTLIDNIKLIVKKENPQKHFNNV